MTTLVQLKHDYDRASNRLYRRDEVGSEFSELYTYGWLVRVPHRPDGHEKSLAADLCLNGKTRAG